MTWSLTNDQESESKEECIAGCLQIRKKGSKKTGCFNRLVPVIQLASTCSWPMQLSCILQSFIATGFRREEELTRVEEGEVRILKAHMAQTFYNQNMHESNSLISWIQTLTHERTAKFQSNVILQRIIKLHSSLFVLSYALYPSLSLLCPPESKSSHQQWSSCSLAFSTSAVVPSPNSSEFFGSGQNLHIQNACFRDACGMLGMGATKCAHLQEHCDKLNRTLWNLIDWTCHTRHAVAGQICEKNYRKEL